MPATDAPSYVLAQYIECHFLGLSSLLLTFGNMQWVGSSKLLQNSVFGHKNEFFLYYSYWDIVNKSSPQYIAVQRCLGKAGFSEKS